MSLIQIPERGILTVQKLHHFIHRNHTTPEKPRPTPLKPIVEWKLHNTLADLLKNGRVAIGSVVAAGHMPDSFSDDALQQAGLERNNVGRVTLDNIQRLHEAKPGKAFRFIDSIEAIETQKAALYRHLEKIYDTAKKKGAEKVLFSVCAISAGFDLNYASALVKLMDDKGPENFVFSIFLPFTKEGVTNYSVAGQGVNPDYWMKQWEDLQVKAEGEYKNSIFIHEAKIRPVKGEQVAPEATPKNVHERGVRVNNDVNSVYSDVDRMLVYQALLTAKGEVRKIRGIFAEAFQTSNALLGGGPEIMAMLLYAGVPLHNFDIVQDGLTETVKPSRRRILTKYYGEFLGLLDAWENNAQITRDWGGRRLRGRFTN